MNALSAWVAGPLTEDFWVPFLLRWLAGFGIAFVAVTLLLMLIRRERLLGPILIVGFALTGLLAYFEKQLEPKQLVSRVQALRKTWDQPASEGGGPMPEPEVDPAEEPEPTTTPKPISPPQPVKPPQPVEPAGPPPVPEGYQSVEVFATSDDGLYSKAAREIFNAYFNGSQNRYGLLPRDLQVEIGAKLRNILRKVPLEEGEKGVIARIDYRPEQTATMFESYGFSRKKWDIEFRIIENYTGLEMPVAAEIVNETIQRKGRYFLGDGYYSEKHRIIRDVERLVYTSPAGKIFHIKVVNTGRYFDPRREGPQPIDLQAF